MAGVMLVGNGFQRRNGVAISAEFAREEFGNAGDGGGTHAGLGFDRGVRNAFGEHLGNLETTGEFDYLLLGKQVAQEGENTVRRIRAGEDFADFEGLRLECRRFHLLYFDKVIYEKLYLDEAICQNECRKIAS